MRNKKRNKETVYKEEAGREEDKAVPKILMNEKTWPHELLNPARWPSGSS